MQQRMMQQCTTTQSEATEHEAVHTRGAGSGGRRVHHPEVAGSPTQHGQQLAQHMPNSGLSAQLCSVPSSVRCTGCPTRGCRSPVRWPGGTASATFTISPSAFTNIGIVPRIPSFVSVTNLWILVLDCVCVCSQSSCWLMTDPSPYNLKKRLCGFTSHKNMA